MEVGDKLSQARAIKEMGRHYSNVGNVEKAVKHYKQALKMFTELGDKAGQAETLHALGHRSNMEEGISYYQRAFDLFEEIGDREWAASCLAGVNLLKQLGRQIEEASAGEPPRVVFSGALCDTFVKSSGAVMYAGKSGTFGVFMRISGDEFKDAFEASPFRFLPGSDKTKILDMSLSVGDSWSMNVPSGGLDLMKLTVTIESDSETVSVPAGKFSSCLKTKIITSEEPEDCEENYCGTKEFVYAPAVGLVKATIIRRDGAIGIAQLTSYTVFGGNKDYLPLTPGNKWVYEWADKEGVFPSTDVYEVAGVDNSKYYISHYYYALKQISV